jgi:hypothetical protein
MTEYEKFEVELCDDCVTTAANGWDERLIGRPLPSPAPLSLLTPDTIVGTSSDDPHFGKSPCEGCGITDHGNRSTATIAVPVDPLAGICMSCAGPIDECDCGGEGSEPWERET